VLAFDENLTLVRTLNNVHRKIPLELEAIGNLATCYHSLDQYEVAGSYYSQLLHLAREEGCEKAEGIALAGMGSANLALGKVDVALGYYTEHLQLFSHKSGSRRNSRLSMRGRANNEEMTGFRDASNVRADRVMREAGAHRNIGLSLMAKGRFAQAVTVHKVELEMWSQYALVSGAGRSHTPGAGSASADAAGDNEEVADVVEVVDDIGLDSDNDSNDSDNGSGSSGRRSVIIAAPSESADTHTIQAMGNLGRAYLGIRRWDDAQATYKRQQHLAKKIGDRTAEAWANGGLGRAVVGFVCADVGLDAVRIATQSLDLPWLFTRGGVSLDALRKRLAQLQDQSGEVIGGRGESGENGDPSDSDLQAHTRAEAEAGQVQTPVVAIKGDAGKEEGKRADEENRNRREEGQPHRQVQKEQLAPASAENQNGDQAQAQVQGQTQGLLALAEKQAKARGQGQGQMQEQRQELEHEQHSLTANQRRILREALKSFRTQLRLGIMLRQRVCPSPTGSSDGGGGRDASATSTRYVPWSSSQEQVALLEELACAACGQVCSLLDQHGEGLTMLQRACELAREAAARVAERAHQQKQRQDEAEARAKAGLMPNLLQAASKGKSSEQQGEDRCTPQFLQYLRGTVAERRSQHLLLYAAALTRAGRPRAAVVEAVAGLTGIGDDSGMPPDAHKRLRLEAAAHASLGSHYLHLGQHKKSIKHLHLSLHLMTELSGPADRQCAVTKSNLGHVYLDLARLELSGSQQQKHKGNTDSDDGSSSSSSNTTGSSNTSSGDTENISHGISFYENALDELEEADPEGFGMVVSQTTSTLESGSPSSSPLSSFKTTPSSLSRGLGSFRGVGSPKGLSRGHGTFGSFKATIMGAAGAHSSEAALCRLGSFAGRAVLCLRLAELYSLRGDLHQSAVFRTKASGYVEKADAR